MNRIISLLILFFPFFALAQEQITLNAAIDTALKNNFDIRIARNNTEISRIYNNYGEAGGLPTISISGSDNEYLTDSYLKTHSGTITETNNSQSNNLNAGISAYMTLFNGFRIIAAKERLNLLQQQSELFLNQQIQNTMAAVMIKYYDIIRQEGYLGIINASLDVSKKRLDIVHQRKNVGMANEAEVLQAQIDVNIEEQSVKSQQLVIDQAKTDLLELMGVKKFYPIEIRDTILVDNSLRLDSIIGYLQHNPQFLSAEQQVRINEQLVKEISAQRYPSIKINTAYDVNLLSGDAGQYRINRSNGPNVGISLQIPIFNGNLYANHRKAAIYNVNNAKLEQESLLNALSASALKTFQSYSTTLDQLNSQQNNYEMSGSLVKLMLNRFRLSQATILEMKAAQESFERSGYLLLNLQYAAKVAEIELKLLIYRLGN